MKFVAKTLYGLEKVLSEELTSLGAVNVKTGNRAVLFEGEMSLLYKANYCLRTALSILMPIAEFRIRSKDDLYKSGSKIEWDRYMDADDTFSIMPVVNSPHFSHTGYAGLLLKDSIADLFRNKTGRRPSVDSANPGILINLHISNDLVTISLDSSVIQGALPVRYIDNFNQNFGFLSTLIALMLITANAYLLVQLNTIHIFIPVETPYGLNTQV